MCWQLVMENVICDGFTATFLHSKSALQRDPSQRCNDLFGVVVPFSRGLADMEVPGASICHPHLSTDTFVLMRWNTLRVGCSSVVLVMSKARWLGSDLWAEEKLDVAGVWEDGSGLASRAYWADNQSYTCTGSVQQEQEFSPPHQC